MHKVHRYHDISTGHRVVGHESKCRHLHGHNYRIHFTCITEAVLLPKPPKGGSINELDDLGRVIDFGVIKEKLCMWLEDKWDHKFLHWEEDPMIRVLRKGVNETRDLFCTDEFQEFEDSLVSLPFNPTAENLAQYLVEVVGPLQLKGTGVTLTEVLIEETAKCHASYGV